MRAFIFRTRGLYLFLSLSIILILKYVTASQVSPAIYLSCLALSIAVLALRVWAAGFVGSTARSGETHADALLTAGPYARVRNPMYLTALLLGSLFAVASGLWYAIMIWIVAYAFVYSNVIPYEEYFLREKFGKEYEDYTRQVPRLFPTVKGYDKRVGVFSLREALLNEVAVFIVVPVFWFLYWWL